MDPADSKPPPEPQDKPPIIPLDWFPQYEGPMVVEPEPAQIYDYETSAALLYEDVRLVRVSVISAFESVAQEFLRDPTLWFKLQDDGFEDFLAEIFDKRFDWAVSKTGPTKRPDGGVDLIAKPRSPGLPILIAIQAKHHGRPDLKTGPSPIREMAIWRHDPFHLGFVVTNTEFTEAALAAAAKMPEFLRPRAGEDLQRWLKGDLSQESRELPATVTLTPDLTFPLSTLESAIRIEVGPAPSVVKRIQASLDIQVNMRANITVRHPDGSES
jgi:hypothetical protein